MRAQRKFASSSSPLESLNFMPNKWTSSHPQKVVSTNGKTEDFLTFLCLRRKFLSDKQHFNFLCSIESFLMKVDFF